MKLLRRLLIVVVTLAVLGTIADRCAWWFVQDYGEELLTQHHVTEPELQIAGFPFLTQVVSQKFKDVTVRSALIDANQTQLRDTTIHATGLKVDLFHRKIKTADHMRITTVLPLETIRNHLAENMKDQQLSVSVTDHQLSLRSTVKGFGYSVKLALAPGDPSQPQPNMTVTFTDLSFDDPMVRTLLGQHLALPPTTVPIPNMNRDLKLDGIKINDDGIHLMVVGDNVSF